jgi:hypothetical protein
MAARDSRGDDNTGEPSPGKDEAVLEVDLVSVSVPAPCMSLCVDVDSYALFNLWCKFRHRYIRNIRHVIVIRCIPVFM